MDKRDRAVLFRNRLAEAMTRNGVNKSQLGRACAVDRSTIGQLLMTDSPRLPNAQLAADAAGALGVSCDWLLGLSDRPERAGDILAASMSFSQARRSSADEQLQVWHLEAAGYKIRHVPATLPDFLKTNEVLRWEYADHQAKSPEQAIQATQSLQSFLKSRQSDVEIAVPLHEFQAFAEGSGYYAGLPRDVRQAQLDHLAETCDELFPTLRLFMFDAHTIYSAPMTVFGPLLAVVYVGRFYLTFRGSDRVASMTQHFDWLVREASVDARDAARTLRDLQVL